MCAKMGKRIIVVFLSIIMVLGNIPPFPVYATLDTLMQEMDILEMTSNVSDINLQASGQLSTSDIYVLSPFKMLSPINQSIQLYIFLKPLLAQCP